MHAWVRVTTWQCMHAWTQTSIPVLQTIETIFVNHHKLRFLAYPREDTTCHHQNLYFLAIQKNKNGEKYYYFCIVLYDIVKILFILFCMV
jgi:hypothetical protein